MIETIRNIKDLSKAPQKATFNVYHLEQNNTNGHAKVLHSRDDVIDYLSQIQSKYKIVFYNTE